MPRPVSADPPLRRPGATPRAARRTRAGRSGGSPGGSSPQPISAAMAVTAARGDPSSPRCSRERSRALPHAGRKGLFDGVCAGGSDTRGRARLATAGDRSLARTRSSARAAVAPYPEDPPVPKAMRGAAGSPPELQAAGVRSAARVARLVRASALADVLPPASVACGPFLPGRSGRPFGACGGYRAMLLLKADGSRGATGSTADPPRTSRHFGKRAGGRPPGPRARRRRSRPVRLPRCLGRPLIPPPALARRSAPPPRAACRRS